MILDYFTFKEFDIRERHFGYVFVITAFFVQIRETSA